MKWAGWHCCLRFAGLDYRNGGAIPLWSLRRK